MAIQLSGSLAITGSLTTSTTIGAQGAINVTNATNPVSFTSTASLYSDGGVRFTKDMYVSGTAYFNNVTVFGTQSIAYISSSQLNIGTNLITVNTDTPTIRFGGLAVYDSGSTGLTGSILWDSEDNQWIYSNPSGSTYDSAVFLVGPRNSGVLGNEQGISCNFLSKGNGLHHMTSSAIFEDGSRTCFYGTSIVTSTGVGCFSGAVCASSVASAGTITGTSGAFSSTLSSNSDFTVNTNRFIVNAATGNTSVAGTLNVTGQACASSVLSSGTICSTGNTCFGGMSVVASCLGIGTTAPGSPLEIYSSNVFNTSTGANPHLIINYNSATAGGPAIKFSRVGISDWSAIQADLSGGTRTLKFIQTTSGVASTQMVINANDGNVGIGAVSPASILELCAATPIITLNQTTGNSNQGINFNTGATTYGKITNNSATGIMTIQNGNATGDGYLIRFITDGNERLRLGITGIACFACQVCAPALDIMPSGIGVSTLGGIMRVVTGGTAVGIGVGQSNTNRYTQISANDLLVYNDDFFIATRCAFPLSIGTCYTSRLTFAATGEACFACQVCAKQYLATFAADGDNMATFINSASSYLYGAGGVFIGSSTAHNCTNLAGGSGALIIRNGASTYTAAIAYNGQAYFCNSVGIGTASPSEKLDICIASTTKTATLRLNNSCYTPKSYFGVLFDNLYITHGGTYSSGWSTDGTNALSAIILGSGNADSSFSVQTIATNSAVSGPCTRLIINKDGIACFACQVCVPMLLASNCVGIGLTSPQAILDVSHTAGTTNIIRVSNGSGNYRWRVDQNFSMIMTNASNTDTFSVTTAGNIFTAGTSYLTGQMCSQGGIHIGGDLTSSGDEATLTLKQGSTTPTSGLYIERSAERKGYYIYISGANDSLTFQRNNAGTKSDVLALSRDTIACFSNNVCVGGVLVVNGSTINVNCDTTTSTDARFNLYTRNSVNGDRASIYTYNLSATTGGCELTYLAFGYCCTNNQGYINMQTKSGGAWCNTMYLINGNVGIGTTSPFSRLHIEGSSANLAVVDNASYAAGVGGAVYLYGNYRTVGDVTVAGYIKGSKTNSTNGDYGFDLIFGNQTYTSGVSEKMRITSAGNVGIGTDSPCGSLSERTIHLAGNSSTNATIYVSRDTYARTILGTNANGGITGTQSNHNLYVVTNDTARLFINNNGIACFACTVCAPFLRMVCSTVAPVVNIENSNTTNDAGVRSLAIQTDRLRFGVSPVTSTYGAIATNGTNSGITFVTYDTAWCERARIECTGIVCFACQVCAPMLLANSEMRLGGTVYQFTGQKSFTENTTGCPFFKIVNSDSQGSYMIFVQLNSTNGPTAAYAGQVYQGFLNKYWGGWQGGGLNISTNSGGAGVSTISAVCICSTGCIVFNVDTSNNGTGTSNTTTAYVTVITNGYIPQFSII